MGLRVSTNIAALQGMRHLGINRSALEKSLERLSSGARINHAGDDAAGLAISETLRSQIRGWRQARRNGQDALSLIQVAEGGLSEVSNIIIRLRELAIQSASDTISDVERGFTNKEFQSLKQEVERIANVTSFNNLPLLKGQGMIYEFQVGIHNNPLQDRIFFSTDRYNCTLDNLQLAGESVSTKHGAQQTLSVLDDALIKINGFRADLGATQNRLQSGISSAAITEENLSGANSRVRDADMAEEMSEMTKYNILSQAGVALLGQANNLTSLALKLIG